MALNASMRIDHELLAVEREHRVHCMLELIAPQAPGVRHRAPLHLALVIDRSGSMAGSKLDTAKRCVIYLARRLRPDDQLSVVAYDDEVTLVHSLAPVGPSTTAIEQAIASIQPGGQTNLSGGWLKAAEQLRGVPGGNGPKKVLLLSDGLTNVGITDAEQLAELAHGATDEGVGTTTIGFGDGFDEDLMTAMADQGSGSAYFAAGVDEAPGIFAQEFEDLVSVVAQNLSVEIRPTADVEVVEVLNDYPSVGVPGGIQVQLGDAYGEELRRILFALHVQQLALLGPASVCDLVLRYVSVGEEVSAHELHIPVLVNLVSADEAAAAAPDAAVVEEVVILKGARAQEEARTLANNGDAEGAGKLLRDTARELRTIAPGSPRAEELVAQAEEMEGFRDSMLSGAFDQLQAKRMRYSSWQKQRNRPRREETP
jgi:Ca-activated chloride channel family protein